MESNIQLQMKIEELENEKPTDPVIFFESQRIYDKGEEFHSSGVPTEYYEIPIGEPDIKRIGSDITILTIFIFI